ncbi:MAG: glycosyltransferase family 39 protein [Planctomycetes bacterium]|nr:glycosyltransferase family 39 protein [Planctomycetota bacterium]
MTDRASKSRRWRAGALLVIFAVALGLRLLYVHGSLPGPPPDTDGYLGIGANLAAGKGFSNDDGRTTAYRPPGYPLFIAAVEKAGGGPWAVIWLQCLASAGVVLLAARLARIVVGGLFALVAAIIVAVDPFQIAVCGEFMTEALFSFIVMAAFVLLLRAVRARSVVRYAVTGLTAAAGALVRPEFFLFAPGALTIAYIWGRKGRKSLYIIVFLLSLIVPPGIWAARNRVSLGSWIVTTTHGGYTHLLAYNEVFYGEVVSGPAPTWSPKSLKSWQEALAGETEGMSEVERDRHFYSKAGVFAASNRQAAARIAFFEARRFWRAFPHSASGTVRVFLGAFFIVLAVLALVGIRVAWRRGPVAHLVVYLLAAETVIHMYYWSNIRMRVPFHGLLAVLAAAGVAVLFGRRAFVGEAVALLKEDTVYSPAV